MKPKVDTVDPRASPDELFELWSIPAYDTGSPELVCGADIGSQKKRVYPGDVLLSRIIPHIRRAWVVRDNSGGRRQIASTEWIVFSTDELLPEYLRRVLISDPFHGRFMQTIIGVGGSLSRANPTAVGDILIPLPPLSVQQEIVAEIEGYQNVVNGARAVLDNYRPHIPIDPAWPMVELGGLCELARGVTYTKADEVSADGHKVLRANNIDNISHQLDLSDVKLIAQSLLLSEDKQLKRDDIFICLASGSKDHIGKVAYIDEDTDYYFGGFMGAVRVRSNRVLSRYVFFNLAAPRFNGFLRQQIAGANINNLGSKLLARFDIPLPPLDTQRAIVAEIEAEQRLVDGNRELIDRMEKKITAVLERVWGEGE